MNSKSLFRSIPPVLAVGAAAAAVSYAATAALAWARYGRPPRPRRPDERDALLDRFMPLYDVVERHHVRIGASPEVTLAVARDMDPLDSAIVRAIFKGREVIMGASPAPIDLPHGLAASVQALGWGVLADVPGREMVFGAVTKPWEPNVTFRSIAPDAFEAFAEPGYVKIAWTLRADPAGDRGSVFRTETRAVATDRVAREKFRRYWAVFSPGIALSRRLSLQPVKCAAEHRQSRTPAVAESGVPMSV
jgi:hypothetical protein